MGKQRDQLTHSSVCGFLLATTEQNWQKCTVIEGVTLLLLRQLLSIKDEKFIFCAITPLSNSIHTMCVNEGYWKHMHQGLQTLRFHYTT